MGVYIKGMEMPETCIECMNSGLRTAIRCTEWTKISAGLRENHRALSCHLTEVPEPHGRLVDADKLIMHLADYQLQESPVWGSNGYGNADKYEAITDCIDAVESARAVIEAEGSNDTRKAKGD